MFRKSRTAFVKPLLAASMVLERHMDSHIRESGLQGLSQMKILLSIARSTGRGKGSKAGKEGGSCNQATIAQTWGVSEAAISRQMVLLEKDKLIKRSLDPTERRQVRLSLTAKGKQVVQETLSLMEKEFSRIFKPLSDTSKKQLTVHLNALLKALSKNTHHYEITDINNSK